jgi:uncharacterized membrane protein YgdD (TMEM256/DUF423 family)
MHKLYLITGTVLSGLAVALGAFGAHGLKKLVSPETVASYQTGVQYQMYHALALILVGLLSEKIANSFINYAGILFIGGIVFFSGSLYLLASFRAMNKLVPSFIYPVTPLGGLLFILGWVMLLVAIVKK